MRSVLLVTLLLAGVALPVVNAGAQEPKVTLNVRDTPFRTALELVFKNSELQYVVEQQVPNVPITLNVKDLSVDAAVRLLIRLSGVPNLTFEKSGGRLFHIRIRRAPRPLREIEEFPDEIEPLQWEKILLSFSDATVIARAFGGKVLGQWPNQQAQHGFEPGGPIEGAEGALQRLLPEGVSDVVGLTADNSLVVRGTPEAIEEFRRVLRFIDRRRREFQLKISAGPLAAQALALNQLPIELRDAGRGGTLLTTLMPRLNVDNTIEVHVSGELKSSGLTRTFNVDVRLRPGEARRIATVGSGKSAVAIWLRATLLSEQEPPLIRE